MLLERLPGWPAAELARLRPGLAGAAGRACGAVHALLAAVPAPDGLREAPGDPVRVAREQVLHLDLHPLNVLVSDRGDLTGVVDWANAAAGDAVLDRARSWAILTLDPAARARHVEPGWAPLVAGWIESGGLHDLPAAARTWACRYMLADLARRYSPDDLKHVATALGEAENR